MSEPYYTDDLVTLYLGDCLEVMRSMPDSSVDSVVTDPPYGLGFMGKAWDALPPGLDFAVEALRVLKPGGHILAFGGSRTWHRLAVAVEDAGFELRDSIAWLYGSGFPKSHNLAGEWQGWGTALKPAFEPIVVGRKPLIGTVAANMLMYGTGALNIDASRIATSAADALAMERANTPGSGRFKTGRSPIGTFERSNPSGKLDTSAGRWPANVILDESQAEALDTQSGVLHSQDPATRYRAQDPAWSPSGTARGEHRKRAQRTGGLNDTGGASRFFYVAKAPKRERPNVDGVAHPTVKPLTLMRYLIKLVTPPGGTVLDPFAGSGTTLEAARLEGFQSIGIERETDYLPLIIQRISKPARQTLFAEIA